MNGEETADVEMTAAEEAWVLWGMSCDVDTGGRCVCGHEGLGIDWHLSDCPAVGYALRLKLRSVMDALVNLGGTP